MRAHSILWIGERMTRDLCKGPRTEEVQELKRPDPEGLRKLIAKLAWSRERSIYVGDTESDVLMGRNAGVITVAVRSGVQPAGRVARAQPDYIVDSFGDILKEVLPRYAEKN